ncbi:toll/interleukin-1 receptor domain-containing protein [Chitinophaga niabensis]|uniref:SEFIR domain-containing protein n=1 Tax=Chitinophaga niabensis TaxID=536979 RepID=A0A1N6D082_9BACT|nr:toll/interleukin-1 receptor domain-containing protein [Chitinophaga niabensis]SIN64182.1 SEFIR domain-containing protein [Chitinophaga niabensis]
MNLIIFLSRISAGLVFVFMVGMSIDPTISKTNPDWHANSVATVAMLFLVTLYLWPVIAEAKSRNVVARIPTARSFTGRRFFTFGRWALAFIIGIMTGEYFLELQFSCGILSLIAVAWLMPPLDRLTFASPAEIAARLKSNSSNSALLKLFPNLGAFAAIIAMGFFAHKNYTVTIIILLISIGLLLVVPIVLFAKGGWKALSLNSFLQPAAVPHQPFKTPASRPDVTQTSHTPPKPPPVRSAQQLSSPKKQIKHKYYSAKAWHWNWPVPKEAQRYPLDERSFNLLIKGFEVSWLESKGYHQRLALHRDPPAFIREVITEVEAYIESMWLRPELLMRNKPLSSRYEPVRFVPDEVSKVWKADRRLRSLYYAAQRFADTPAKLVTLSFRAMAPHIAEYRAMINLIKHLRHSLSRMPGQHVKKVPDPIIKPTQTEDTIPIVFISYSWDSPEHEDWILNLATKLRENGVDAILDKWDIGFLGKLLPHFMETSIFKSHRVICVMTPNYKKKTENLTGGVGYEYSIITAEIFTDNINTSKFIPLFRSGTDADAIPTALKGRKYVDMRDDTQFDEKFIHELLRDIHEEPKFKKPAIGKKTKF